MSEKLALRPIEKEDIAFLHALYTDPTVVKYWFIETYHSKAKIEKSLEEDLNDESSRNFILHKEEEQIGFVNLYSIDPVHSHAEFGIMIDPKQQGKGYAKHATKLAMDYAFRILNLHKLFLFVDVENDIAKKVYEKVGFQEEAVLKEKFFVDGSYHDVVYMSAFQRDYLRA